MDPLDPIVAALATAALLFLPGWLMLLALRAQRGLDPMLVPAAGLAVSLALLAPALGLVLCIGTSIWWCAAWLVACAIVAGVFAWRRRRRLLSLGGARRVTLVGLLTVLVAVGGGALALWNGGDLRRDQIYHTARVVKLVELDAPTFASASRIEGGGVTTPYAFPLWHGAQAVVVRMTGVEPTLLAWLLPSLLVPVSILAFAGLARVVLGSPEAGFAAAIAWGLLRLVDYAPDYRFLATAQWPGMVAAMIVVPLVCALLVPALYERVFARRRAALLLGAIATLVIVGVHGNYVLFPGLLVAGALAWLLVWDRTLDWRRALALCGTWGGAAAIGLLALLPVLREHNGSADEGGVDSLVLGSRNANYFEQVHGGWALLLEPLASRPLTILAFAAATLLVFVATRSRLTALGAAGLAAVIACARVPVIAEAVLGLGNLTAVTRLWLAVTIPTTLALAATLLLLERLLRSPRTLRILTGVGIVAVAGWYVLRASNLTLQTTRELLVSGLLATVTLGLVVGIIVRFGEPGLPPGEVLRYRQGRLVRFDRREAIVAAVVVAGMFVAAGLLLDGRYEHALHRDARLGAAIDHRDELATVLRPGDVVLADEQDAYVLPAALPVYVAGDFKHWLEKSDDTETVDRLDDVRTYFAPDTSDSTRADILRRRHVDALVIRADHRDLAPRDAERIGPWLVARTA
jgi:hypothetical protein